METINEGNYQQSERNMKKPSHYTHYMNTTKAETVTARHRGNLDSINREHKHGEDRLDNEMRKELYNELF